MRCTQQTAGMSQGEITPPIAIAIAEQAALSSQDLTRKHLQTTARSSCCITSNFDDDAKIRDHLPNQEAPEVGLSATLCRSSKAVTNRFQTGLVEALVDGSSFLENSDAESGDNKPFHPPEFLERWLKEVTNRFDESSSGSKLSLR
jgi:hypothetical protein